MLSPFIQEFIEQITNQTTHLTQLSNRWNELRFLASTIRGELEHPTYISFTGCGDNYYVAELGSQILNYHIKREHKRTGIVAGHAHHPFSLRHYPPMPSVTSRLSIAISASGETPITVKAQAVLSDNDWLSFAITNRPVSTLVDFADYSFCTNIDAGKYHHPVATTITAIWALQVLSATLVSAEPLSPSYAEAYHSLQRMGMTLQAFSSSQVLQQTIEEVGEWFTQKVETNDSSSKAPPHSFSVLSGGTGLSVAHLLVLKIGELTWIPGHAFNIEEYVHSPLLTASPATPVIILIPDSHVYHRVLPLVSFFEAHNISYIDIAPEGIPVIPTSAVSMRFPIDRIPSIYLGIPLLHLCHRITGAIASKRVHSVTDWRFGDEHTKLIQQG